MTAGATSSQWLRAHSRIVRSQYGEDGILHAMLDRLPPGPRVCVEFGAWDGEHLSNCYDLIRTRGFHGVLIEGDPIRFAELRRKAPSLGSVDAVNAFVGTSGGDALDAILSRAGVPADFDVLSIDIDNDDYWVWRALLRYQPRIVVIEVNSQFGPHREVVATPRMRTFTARSGTSFASMVALGKSKGYELAIHTGNCLFVRRDLAPLLDVAPADWRSLFDEHFSKASSVTQRARTMLGDLAHRRVSMRGLFHRPSALPG